MGNIMKKNIGTKKKHVIYRICELFRKKEEYQLQIGIKFLNKPVILIKSKGNITMSSLITNLDSVTLTATLLDALGAEVKVDAGSVVWLNSNSAVIKLEPSADTLTATASSVGVGKTTVTATVGAFTGTYEIDVSASAATQLVITASAPFVTPPVAVPAPAPVAASTEVTADAPAQVAA